MTTFRIRFDADTIVTTGVIAGIVLAAFEMVAAATLTDADAAAPMRMHAAIVIGRKALDPPYSLSAAVLTGLAVHLVVSLLFAALFAGVITASPPSHQTA